MRVCGTFFPGMRVWAGGPRVCHARGGNCDMCESGMVVWGSTGLGTGSHPTKMGGMC